MKTYIRGVIQNMAQEEMLSLISPDTLARVKKTDPNPEIRVFCIGHEGTADASEISFGAKVKKAFEYVRNMIVQLVERVKVGTATFVNHVDTNAHAGREQVGEVIGKGLRIIEGKLSALAAVYIYPQYKQEALDVASIEANIAYEPKSATRAEVIAVDDITGIALASSKWARPAFPGATLLGVIQAFAQTQHEAGGTMTPAEIKAAIAEGKFKITDIYTPDEITASDPAVQAKQTEYAHTKRLEKQLGEEHERVVTLTREKEEATTKIKTLNEQVSTTQVGSLFTDESKARKYNDKQRTFIQKNLGQFKSDKAGEELKKDFQVFLDKQQADFLENAKLMGLDPAVVGAPAAEGEGTGTPAAAAGAGVNNADGQGGGKDMNDPKNNDFIPAE